MRSETAAAPSSACEAMRRVNGAGLRRARA